MKSSRIELENLVRTGQNKNLQFDQRKEALLSFEKQYKTLSTQEKANLEIYLYLRHYNHKKISATEGQRRFF